MAVASGVLVAVAIVVRGKVEARGPRAAAQQLVGTRAVEGVPTSPETPDLVPPKRLRTAGVARPGESYEARTERFLRHARGLEEGIERMFARRLEEDEKQRLFALGLKPLERVAELKSIGAETRARIAEDLLALASDQFTRARNLRRSRAADAPVFDALLEDARRFHEGSELVIAKAVRLGG